MHASVALPFRTALVFALTLAPASGLEAENAVLDAVDDTVNAAWTFATHGPVFSTAAAEDAEIYIGSDDGHLYALDATDGTLRWSTPLGGRVRSRAWIEGPSLFVTSENHAFALRREDGAVLWTFSPDDARGAGPADTWDYHQSSPVVHGDLVYFGRGNGRLHALERTSGQLRFSVETVERAAIRSTPAIARGTVYFGDWNGVIYAVDAATGERRWMRETCPAPKPYPQFGGAVSAMVVHDGRLHFGLRNPDVLGLDLADGAVAWRFTAQDGSWVPGTPVIAEGTLYITGSDDHRVHALDVASGQPRWSCDVGANMFVAPLMHGDRLLVTDGDSYAASPGRGRLHVIDRATGRRIRTVALGANACASSPVLVGNRVVIGREDGTVAAFDLAALIP